MSFRRLLRAPARRLVYPVVEAITLLVLMARSKAGRSCGKAHALVPGGGQRVLVVAAHPDDETIGCAGAILRHAAAGDVVKVLIVTDGSGSRAGGLKRDEMAARRRSEVERIRGIFSGVRIEELGFVEGAWDTALLEEGLKSHLESERPQVVYGPSCIDFHPEHIAVGKVLAEALDKLPPEERPVVRVYEMQVPLGCELANLYTPLAEYRSVKERAIEAYRSQGGALGLWRREARYLGGMSGAGKGAEAFWELSTESYCLIMKFADWDWRSTPFRSLSGRPFGDLAAHLRGREVRLQLRGITESHPAHVSSNRI
jgi:LmbE family N-acetylglucosaminyl deacetylase